LTRSLLAIPALLLGLGICACDSVKAQETQPASPPVAKEAWSIGIYTGPSPFELSEPQGISNPVLTAADVTDFDADILAHPFMVVSDSMYYMFFTVKHGATDQGGIGLAQSKNGFDWEYKQLVIQEPFVQSYPYVFKWKNDYYLIPEAHTETSVRLYRATSFPDKWTYVKDLITGERFISASVVHYNDRWWMFVAPQGDNDTLRLFFASDLTGTWTEHPQSPIVKKDQNIARPGGRLLVVDGALYRMGQDCHPTYGNQVHAFQVNQISTTAYRETKIEPPLIRATSKGWNAKAMHHIDFHSKGKKKWIAAVDALGILPPENQ